MNTLKKVDLICKECGKAKILPLDGQKFTHYLQGASLENVFPEMDIDDQNLIIKGLCPECMIVTV